MRRATNECTWLVSTRRAIKEKEDKERNCLCHTILNLSSPFASLLPLFFILHHISPCLWEAGIWMRLPRGCATWSWGTVRLMPAPRLCHIIPYGACCDGGVITQMPPSKQHQHCMLPRYTPCGTSISVPLQKVTPCYWLPVSFLQVLIAEKNEAQLEEERREKMWVIYLLLFMVGTSMHLATVH